MLLIYVFHGLPLVSIFILNIRLLFWLASSKRRQDGEQGKWTENNEAEASVQSYNFLFSVEEAVSRVMAKTVSNVWVTCFVSACLIVAYVPYLAKWQLEALEPMGPPNYK